MFRIFARQLTTVESPGCTRNIDAGACGKVAEYLVLCRWFLKSGIIA